MPDQNENQTTRLDETGPTDRLSDPRTKDPSAVRIRLALGVLTWFVILGLMIDSYLAARTIPTSHLPILIGAALTLLGVDQLPRLFGGGQ